MDTTILEDLGLSKGEVKIYLTLLELGTTKVGAIIEKSGMASSAVHNSINSLIEKGIVSYIKKGKIKFYIASPPKHITDFIDQKKKRFLDIIPILESKGRANKEKQEAEIFEGIKGVTTMLNILIEDGKKGEEYFFFSSYEIEKNKEIQEFFNKYDIKRKEKGLVIKGLAPRELKPLFEKRKMLLMKYTLFPIPSSISIFKDKLALISWDEKPIGYLIRSKQITESFIDYFGKMWKLAKK